MFELAQSAEPAPTTMNKAQVRYREIVWYFDSLPDSEAIFEENGLFVLRDLPSQTLRV